MRKTRVKYRLAIQEYVDGKPRRFRNVMIEAKPGSLDKLTERAIKAFRYEHQSWIASFRDWLNQRGSSGLLKHHGVGSDLFDSESVGKDTIPLEFIRSEIEVELQESRCKE